MRTIFYLVVLSSLFSCNSINNTVEISIINNSDKIIKNVKCYTSESKEGVTFALLNPYEKADKHLSMKKNKTDGNYILEFTNENGETIKHIDSYYTNGKTLSNTIIFEIQNDTVIYRTE